MVMVFVLNMLLHLNIISISASVIVIVIVASQLKTCEQCFSTKYYFINGTPSLLKILLTVFHQCVL